MELALGWLNAGLASEIRRQTEASVNVPVEEKRDVIDHVLRIIAADDLQPVLAFDDTDRWWREPAKQAVDGFFHGVIRWVNELSASLVVAVHPKYLRGGRSKRKTLAHLDTRVEVPDLDHRDQLAALIDARIAAHVGRSEHAGAKWSDVFTEAAIEKLFGFYLQRGVFMRDAIQVAHRALVEASDQGEVRISDWFVEAAIAAS
jgi:hypothetical protein